eukprot:TRINITY_DN2729_c1_g2_i1.p1 TRINITY_DN2729_c1_g2~~TRINITY_DN2729_c1_g2_i1.p1  ORF type:complete len:595 (-),score=160.09 TRINITY_DN2729_c1_g2_i1:103-1887(-)
MSSDDEPQTKKSGVKSKELKKRIEGFGNGPMPPPVSENPADILWGRVSEDQTFMSWYDSARSSVNSVLDAVDDTVNAIADAVDDTIAAVIGEDDEPELPPGPPPRRGGGEGSTGKSNGGDGTAKKKKKKVDSGERSGVDWKEVVTNICVEGDLEEFVLNVRGQVKNDFEEREVGGLLADALLNEVKAGPTLRILHVLQAVVADDNLEAAQEVIRTRCATKLGKLQASPCFAKLSTEILGDFQAKKEDETSAASSSTAKKAAAPAPPTTDLLDMAAPAAPAPKAKPSKSAAAAEPEDLIGLSAPSAAPAASAAVPALAPPKASANGLVRRGTRVRAVWAGDGKVYPAVVESVRGKEVVLNWMRRSAASTAAESFVCDVGDDTTHETVNLADVQVVSGPPAARSAAGRAGPGDLLDFDAAPAPASPTSDITGTLGGLQDLNLGGGAAAAPAPPAVDLFAQMRPGAPAGGNSWAAGAGMQAGATSGFPAAPGSMAALAAGGRPAAGGYMGASMPSAAPTTGYAAAFGGTSAPLGATAMIGGGAAIGGGVASISIGAPRQAQAVGKIPSPKSVAAATSNGSAKKDLQLGDAFELAGVR